MSPKSETAPAPTRAISESNTRHHDTDPRRLFLAACRDERWREEQVIAALIVSPLAREKFRRLGIGPVFFSSSDAAMAAKWALGPTPSMTPDIERALLRPVSATTTLADQIAFHVGVLERGKRERWALRDIRRHAAWFAARWLGPHLRWMASRLEAGEPLGRLMREVDALLRMARDASPYGRAC